MWKKKMLKKCEAASYINEQLSPLNNKVNVSLTDEKNAQVVAQNVHTHHYVCGICKKPIALCESFPDHLQTHNDDTSDECSICTKSLDNKKEYYNHLIMHSKIKPQPCNSCSKTYIIWLRLKLHLFWHDKTYLCHLCDTTFVFKEHFEKHLLIHTVKEYQTCKICKKLGNQNSCDQITAHPKKSHQCIDCGKVFSKKSSLSAHKLMHRFRCQICLKDFRVRADSICHIRCDHPEFSFQTDMTNHLSCSYSESSNQMDLTCHLKVSSLEDSDKIDLTVNGPDNNSDPEASDKIDLTGNGPDNNSDPST